MGFIPILLTLSGFILLFILVVNQSIKTKKEQYKTTLTSLAQSVEMEVPDQNLSVETLEKQLVNISSLSDQQIVTAKALLGKAKLLRHQYNQLITSKPYSFVAKIAGHSLI